jgi:putative nucleotidyltransferase with HDIG domain
MQDLIEFKKVFLKKVIISFNLKFAKLLKECEHCDDYNRLSPHHSEGDIYTHTMMVLKSGLDILNNHSITDEDTISAVILGCLLHDIGKPFAKSVRSESCKTTGVLIEKTYFTGHEKASADIAIKFLKDLQVSVKIRDAVLFAVLYHTAAHDKKNNSYLYGYGNDISEFNKTVLLLVNEADQNGRIQT